MIVLKILLSLIASPVLVTYMVLDEMFEAKPYTFIGWWRWMSS